MDELHQIATVLGSLGIRFESIDFEATETGSYDQEAQIRTTTPVTDKIRLIMSYRGGRIDKTYTIEQIRSALVTDASRPPGRTERADRTPTGIVSRILRR